jgi:hypothetical protein
MPITYTNRRSQTYYLHAGKTKAGRPHYYMSMKTAGNPLEAIPDGYEVWENPEDAQVFVRKIPPKTITDAEVELVRTLAKTKAKTPYTIVDVQAKAIVLYAGDFDVWEHERKLSVFADVARSSLRRFMEEQMQYLPMLRFLLAV